MSLRHHLTAAAVFIALSVLLTWPLARLMGVAVAWPGDPLLNTWILDWDWWATFHHPLSLFDANAFYPAHGALAFSENLYGIALVLFPFRAAGVPPLAAYNLAMLLGYAFSGFGAYVLGRTVTGSWLAGIAAGVFYAFVPFRITHTAQVQHVWGGWLPLMIAALLHYARQPDWSRAAMFGAAFLMNGLTNIHWLLFGTIAIAMTWLIVRPRFVPIAACTLAAVVLLAPFLWPYYRVSRGYGMLRGWRETKSFSATPSDWLVANPQYPLYRSLANARVDPERWLFPGALAILLSIAAVVSRDRRALAIGFAWVALGFIGSLGTHVIFHRFLFRHVAGFRAIRVPARWANIAYVGMALLIALAVRAIARDRRWVAALIAVAFVIELFAAPLPWYLAVAENPPVYSWMRDAKPHATLELPMDAAGLGFVYLLRATAHHTPIANGTPGFGPPVTLQLSRLTRATPISDDFLPLLRRLGIDTVVVHADYIAANVRPWLQSELARGRLAFVRRFDGGMYGDWVFSTRGGNGPRPADLDAFLRGETTFNSDVFGWTELPNPGEVMKRHLLYVSGFAFSPYGIREVNVLMNDRALKFPMPLFDDPNLRRRWPWYDATTAPRYRWALDKRPPGVPEKTDIQVEVIDGRGRRVFMDDRWFVWP